MSVIPGMGVREDIAFIYGRYRRVAYLVKSARKHIRMFFMSAWARTSILSYWCVCVCVCVCVCMFVHDSLTVTTIRLHHGVIYTHTNIHILPTNEPCWEWTFQTCTQIRCKDTCTVTQTLSQGIVFTCLSGDAIRIAWLSGISTLTDAASPP